MGGFFGFVGYPVSQNQEILYKKDKTSLLDAIFDLKIHTNAFAAISWSRHHQGSLQCSWNHCLDQWMAAFQPGARSNPVGKVCVQLLLNACL